MFTAYSTPIISHSLSFSGIKGLPLSEEDITTLTHLFLFSIHIITQIYIVLSAIAIRIAGYHTYFIPNASFKNPTILFSYSPYIIFSLLSESLLSTKYLPVSLLIDKESSGQPSNLLVDALSII